MNKSIVFVRAGTHSELFG